MLDPSVKLSIENQKCDDLDDHDTNDAGVMIPICCPCFAGDTKRDDHYFISISQSDNSFLARDHLLITFTNSVDPDKTQSLGLFDTDGFPERSFWKAN